MKKLLFITGLCALVIVGLITLTESKRQAFAAVTACDSGTDLSYDQAVDELASGGIIFDRNVDLSANRVTVTVTNNTICSVPVSLADYKMFGPYSPATQSQQELFDSFAKIDIAASSTQVLSVAIPDCESQYDIWYGDFIVHIPDNQPYGSLLAGDQVRLDQYCVHATSTPPVTAVIHIIKHVINDDGGTSTASSFMIHVMSSSTDIAGSPLAGLESPGTSYTVATGTYAVSEDTVSSYTASFSGDCDASGILSVIDSSDRTCTLTNNDIGTTTATSTSPVTPPTTPIITTSPVGGGGSSSGGCAYGFNFALGRCNYYPTITATPAAAVQPIATAITPNWPSAGFGPDDASFGPSLQTAVYVGMLALIITFATLYATNRTRRYTR